MCPPCPCSWAIGVVLYRLITGHRYPFATPSNPLGEVASGVELFAMGEACGWAVQWPVDFDATHFPPAMKSLVEGLLR